MITGIVFVVLAGLGAITRAAIGHRLNRHDGFPFGTLLVNVTGSFGLGLLHSIAPPTFTILGLGFIGSYTTFSSFARDAVMLAELRQILQLFAYLSASVALSVFGAALGLALA